MTATLVLLPGMDGTGSLFDGFVAALGGRVDARVVRHPTDQPLDYPRLAEIARAFIPPEGPYVLLGESFSGPVAILLAAQHPGRLQGLVLCCTFASSPKPWLKHPLQALLRWPWPLPPPWLLCAALMGEFSTPPLRAALKRAVAAVEPGVMRHRLAQVMGVDVSDRLREVKVPLLDLRATRDRLVTMASAREIQRLCPTVQTVCLPGPHFLLQALPRECADAVLRFVDGLPAAHP